MSGGFSFGFSTGFFLVIVGPSGITVVSLGRQWRRR